MSFWRVEIALANILLFWLIFCMVIDKTLPSARSENSQVAMAIVGSGQFSELTIDDDGKAIVATIRKVSGGVEVKRLPLEICTICFVPEVEVGDGDSASETNEDDGSVPISKAAISPNALPRTGLTGTEELFSGAIPEAMTFVEYRTFPINEPNKSETTRVGRVIYGSRYVFFVSEEWARRCYSIERFGDLFAIAG